MIMTDTYISNRQVTAIHALVWVLIALPVPCLAGSAYKSVDADGRVSYSEQPPTDGKVHQTINFTAFPSSPLSESVLRFREEMRQRAGTRAAKPSLAPSDTPLLFTAQWCGYCKKAKAYMAEKGIAYQEYDIDTELGMQTFEESGSSGGIPVLIWRQQKIQGFSLAGYDALFQQKK